MSGGGLGWAVANLGIFTVLARYGYRLSRGRSSLGAAGAVVSVAGVALAVWARRELGRNWSKDAAVVERQELVVRGPYAVVRHPIYSGFLALMLGTALLVDSIGVYGLCTLQGVFLTVKARQEESLLAVEFPDDYRAYHARTRAFIPWLV